MNLPRFLISNFSWSVAIYDASSVIPSVSLSVMSFDTKTGVIVVFLVLYICIFAYEYEIDSVCLLGELSGVPILFIKLSLGVILLISFIIAPTCHYHPFSLHPIIFLWYDSYLWPVLLADYMLLK